MRNFRVVQEYYNHYKKSIIDTKVSDNETMIDKWYFQIGRSAVEVIAASCLASNIQKVERVLDLPCGYGRVLRHLVHFFPGAKFDACDLDMGGVDYCATRFGANAICSRPDLTEVDFCAMYDVIWVGSLFTHTAEDITHRWMSHLAKYLKPNGIVVATLHGRWSEHVHKIAPYISPERWQKILDQYHSHGYGYCDYIQEESHDFIAGNYGISLIKPHIMVKIIEEIPGVRIFLYNERAWADHQDVVAFGRPAFDLSWSSTEVD